MKEGECEDCWGKGIAFAGIVVMGDVHGGRRPTRTYRYCACKARKSFGTDTAGDCQGRGASVTLGAFRLDSVMDEAT